MAIKGSNSLGNGLEASHRSDRPTEIEKESERGVGLEGERGF